MSLFFLKTVLRAVFRPESRGALVVPPLLVLSSLIFLIGPEVVFRPAVLAAGTPADGVISKMGDGLLGSWVEVNYQRTSDHAPRFKTRLDAAGFRRMEILGKVRLRYLAWLPEFGALEDDFGYARKNAWWIGILVTLSSGAFFYRLYRVLFTQDSGG